jgi:hypothetical protein
MWRRLAVLWTAMAAVLVVLFLPIKTHAVKLDMPAGSQIDTHQVEATIQWISIVAPAVVLLAILGVFVWLHFRIIRRYRKAG